MVNSRKDWGPLSDTLSQNKRRERNANLTGRGYKLENQGRDQKSPCQLAFCGRRWGCLKCDPGSPPLPRLLVAAGRLEKPSGLEAPLCFFLLTPGLARVVWTDGVKYGSGAKH